MVTEEMATELLEAVKLGDEMSIQMMVNQINEANSPISEPSALYNEIGKLTRNVHEQIKALALDEKLATNVSQLPKAKDDINYMIATNEKSAMTTIENVEQTLSELTNATLEGKSIYLKISEFFEKKLNSVEFIDLMKRIEAHLLANKTIVDNVTKGMNDILIAQSSQDLTGQVGNRVSNVIVEIQDNLIDLLQLFNTEIKIKEEDPCALSGPSINPENDEQVVNSQEDVDDLLASLGF